LFILYLHCRGFKVACRVSIKYPDVIQRTFGI
jgi:hypothetical protein